MDPVGHDLTAGVLAAVTVGSYRHSRRAGLDLAATHAALDQTIAAQFGGERSVTGRLAQLDCLTGRLQWVNAGHPLPLLVRRAKVVDTLACHPVPPLGLGMLVRETLAGQPAAETMRRLAHAILVHQGRTPRDDATMGFLDGQDHREIWPEPAAATHFIDGAQDRRFGRSHGPSDHALAQLA
jgi:Stage II sporulation protein E (SpoIIE)